MDEDLKSLIADAALAEELFDIEELEEFAEDYRDRRGECEPCLPVVIERGDLLGPGPPFLDGVQRGEGR